jgi:hypothetical protein
VQEGRKFSSGIRKPYWVNVDFMGTFLSPSPPTSAAMNPYNHDIIGKCGCVIGQINYSWAP